MINLHVTVSFNSIRYFEYMVANYRALARVPDRVKFHVYCLDPVSAFLLRRHAAVDKLFELPTTGGSTGHAMAIELALREAPRGDINIVADSDTAVFARAWDQIVIDAVGPDGPYGMIGMSYEDVGGVSSGSQKHQSYKRAPTLTWMALSPRFDFSTLKCRPDKANTILIDSPELSTIYGLSLGFTLVKDVGWQIPEFLHRHSIPHLTFDLVKPTSAEARAMVGTTDYHDEFHWQGRPFLAHQRGSMTHRFRIDPLSRDFYDACDRFLDNPAWSVEATAMDRALAATQNVVRATKTGIKRAMGMPIGRA